MEGKIWGIALRRVKEGSTTNLLIPVVTVISSINYQEIILSNKKVQNSIKVFIFLINIDYLLL